MTDLISFFKTDLVNDHVADDVNKLIAASIRPEYANTETISATKTLTDSDCQFQFLTASGADRTVKLAAEAITNHPTLIYNSGASLNIVVQNNGATATFATLAPDEWLIFIPLNAEGWRAWAPPEREYKLSPTVASNNLTLALKHLDGTDPSTTRPIVFTINGVKRHVTAALSVTVNAGAASGAGTFNAGAASLATKAIDYFAYVSWRAASSAVVLGFGRFPYAALGSDASGTAANEKYIAWSTAPAGTDDVINIGRFEATNSGSASYNWSVPTYTNDNLRHVATYETRELSIAPQWTNLTVGNATLYGKYQLIGRRQKFRTGIILGNTSSMGTAPSVATPFAFSALGTAQENLGNGVVRDTGSALYACAVLLLSGSIYPQISTASGTYATYDNITATVPHAWASTDELSLYAEGIY